jgi:hypothetical protein
MLCKKIINALFFTILIGLSILLFLITLIITPAYVTQEPLQPDNIFKTKNCTIAMIGTKPVICETIRIYNAPTNELRIMITKYLNLWKQPISTVYSIEVLEKDTLD